ncbi:hypothetical protein N7G274_010170 [Stereocaulon virgatum]|uniref:Uncharacterized protein n=1 Tax=Stereocaulon virgatum TaxID=373712 RepID=A0ABR4A140_9LECA
MFSNGMLLKAYDSLCVGTKGTARSKPVLHNYSLLRLAMQVRPRHVAHVSTAYNFTVEIIDLAQPPSGLRDERVKRIIGANGTFQTTLGTEFILSLKRRRVTTTNV